MYFRNPDEVYMTWNHVGPTMYDSYGAKPTHGYFDIDVSKDKY